jgi:hypothetical protein
MECKDNRPFEWGYYPPYTFKVLIYLVEEDLFISSGPLERYAFSSYYFARITGQGPGIGISNVEKNYDYTKEILNLVLRIVLTIAVEMGLAFAFKFGSKKHLLTIGITNVCTQIGLNVFLNIIYHFRGALSFYKWFFFLEFLVFIAEALAYSLVMLKFDNKAKIYKCVFYALTANALSCLLGFVIARYGMISY